MVVVIVIIVEECDFGNDDFPWVGVVVVVFMVGFQSVQSCDHQSDVGKNSMDRVASLSLSMSSQGAGIRNRDDDDDDDDGSLCKNRHLRGTSAAVTISETTCSSMGVTTGRRSGCKTSTA